MYLQNKYSQCYYNIVNRAKSRATTRKQAKKIFGYIEKHHIIPKAFGGNNDIDNLVFLTAREHFICHLLLTKMVNGKAKYQMYKALHLMTVSTNKHQRHRCSSRMFETIRRNAAIAHSKLTNGKPKHTVSSKEILSRKATGRVSGFKDKSHTVSSKKLLSIARSKACVSPYGEIFNSTIEAALAYNVSAESLRGKISRGVSGWKFI